MNFKHLLIPFLVICLLVAVYFLPKIKAIEKIDIHEHIKDIKQAERVLKVMNDLNIKKMVLLGTPSMTFGENTDVFEKYDEHNEEMLEVKEKYPDRFLVFVTINPSDVDAVQKLENYYKRGASGLKLYHGVIQTLGPINSNEMYKIYDKCRELHLPVIIHVEISNATQL